MSVSVVVERKISAAKIIDHILNATDIALGNVFSVMYVPQGKTKYTVWPGILLKNVYIVVKKKSMNAKPYNQSLKFFKGTRAINIRQAVNKNIERFA
jgi:hypothetical protein